MQDQYVRENLTAVCKYFQTGYCRNGKKCDKLHENNTCQERVFRDQNCRDIHPRTCKYFSKYNYCRYKEQCAYSHHIDKYSVKLDDLEKQIKSLKGEIRMLSKTKNDILTKPINIEADNMNVQLCLQNEAKDIN